MKEEIKEEKWFDRRDVWFGFTALGYSLSLVFIIMVGVMESVIPLIFAAISGAFGGFSNRRAYELARLWRKNEGRW